MADDYEAMPWLLTIIHGSGSTTYGPFEKAGAVETRDGYRDDGFICEAWAAAAPMPTVVPLTLLPL